jgi:hypothetical protein
MVENLPALILSSLRLSYGKTGSSSNPHHKPHPMEDAVDGNGEIKRREPQRPKAFSDKKSIRENVDGDGHHPHDIKAHISKKCLKD